MRAIIILAGGSSERLRAAGLLGELASKVYLPIEGVPNLQRTVRMCETLHDLPVLIVHEGAAKPTKGESIAAAASHFGVQFTEFVVILGDVIWQSSELLELLFMGTNKLLHHPTNTFTGKNYDEVLGAVISRKMLNVVSACKHMRELPAAIFEKVVGGGWSDDIDCEDDYHQRLPQLRLLAASDLCVRAPSQLA